MLFGLPMQLVSAIFGGVMGFFTKRSAMMAELQAAERKHQLDAMLATTKANRSGVRDEIKLLKAQAEYEKVLSEADPHRSETRKNIAYIMVFALAIIVPGIVLLGNFNWFEIHQYQTAGFFGFFKETVIDVVTAVGLPLLWLEGVTSLVSLIVSFYFGVSSAKFTNPYVERK